MYFVDGGLQRAECDGMGKSRRFSNHEGKFAGGGGLYINGKGGGH